MTSAEALAQLALKAELCRFKVEAVETLPALTVDGAHPVGVATLDGTDIPVVGGDGDKKDDAEAAAEAELVAAFVNGGAAS